MPSALTVLRRMACLGDQPSGGETHASRRDSDHGDEATRSSADATRTSLTRHLPVSGMPRTPLLIPLALGLVFQGGIGLL